jgi:D-alanyl-D-alanine carboxypeptidase
MQPYADRLTCLHAELGIPADYAATRGIAPQPQARLLTPLGLDCQGRDQFAAPEAAAAWQTMQAAALNDLVALHLVSAFRGVDYQAGIIRRKLAQGQSIDAILMVSAAPGFSEHHTGRAFDLTTNDSPMLEESFESTDAFRWLAQHAARYGFAMTMGRQNPAGFIYEPWHWVFSPTA